jgi:uncharacterized protein YbbC (DUF1343 family)/CubicO group peptidase (beta-lactamase class C family)
MTGRIALLAAVVILAAPAPAVPDFDASDTLDSIVEKAVADGEIPGAVLLVGHAGRTLHRKAYGARALQPARERMTPDTVFDAASLTKVVATAAAVMQLFEQGKIRLNDRVTEYLPEFQGGHSAITVRHLVTHFSGLRPGIERTPPWVGYETGIRKALAEKPLSEPGERFVYSDINYILLGEIVRRVSGEPLGEYTREHIFEPLRMRDTGFLPSRNLRRRIAPTEKPPGEPQPLRGVVHDPTARAMGGVAGHAGLFTTADDLAHFAEMLLARGEYRGSRILQPLTVRKMTTSQSPADQPVLRGVGFDLDSAYSAPRGELFPVGSFGHTGFTGTSLWIDPVTRTYVILLTNAVHPAVKRPISGLRARVATAVAAALGIDLPGVSITGYNETLAGARTRPRLHRNGQALTGLDVLAGEQFAPLRGKRVGLITNHTGLAQDGTRNIDLMLRAGVNLAALFSPEHGIGGEADVEEISDARDSATGLPIWSLYSGARRRPTESMLANVDVLVFDIQDVGARFYTYMCTMLYAMEEAAKRNIPFFVLDRPNPITGVYVEGPLLDPELESFVGCFPLPLRHGMTLGEIAAMANTERRIGADLRVITMKGWQRGDWFDSVGLFWTNPSPNMRSLNAALLYPGLAMLEASDNYSVGRGTDSPFEQIGAGWINGQELARYLNQRKAPGVRVYPTRFRPASSRFAGQWIDGVRFVITDRELLDSVRLGLEVAAALEKLYPGKIRWTANERLIGSRATVLALERGEDPRAIEEGFRESLEQFLARREAYLLYR